MRSLASLLELALLLANILFDRKSTRLRPPVRRGIFTSSLRQLPQTNQSDPFHTSKLLITPPRLTAPSTIEVPELMQSMCHRNPWVTAHDDFHEMDNPLFNYTFQTDAVDNRFPSGNPISLHAMKTENFARPRLASTRWQIFSGPFGTGMLTNNKVTILMRTNLLLANAPT
jgi:hypothetical protein